MSDVSGALVGGALADIDHAGTSLQAAGGASLDMAQSAARSADLVVAEIDDITRQLSTAFTETADRLRAEIRRARATLETADWSGRSRGAADAAEAELNGTVAATLDEAMIGVDQLSTTLQRMVLGFHDDITGQFVTVLSSINERYTGLSRGTAAFAEGLRQVDAGISFG